MPIRCEIVSQDRIVFQGDVDSVNLPGVEGDMGILPNHSPVLTVLRFGIITVHDKKQNRDQFFTVAGGVVEVQPDQVTVLADAAENVEEIDVHRAEIAKKKAEELLKQPSIKQDMDEYLTIRAKLLRSNLRLEAVSRYRYRRQH